MRNPILILATVIAAGALSLGLWSWQQWSRTVHANSSEITMATVLPAPRALPAVMMTNQDGQEIDISQPSGRWSLWFFGFTHCPDVCPNTLGMLATVKQALASKTEDLQIDMIFVSVDPERDSIKKIKDYVLYFDPDMIGLTGSTEAVNKLTGSLYLPYVLEEADENGSYNVEHSGALVLITPEAAAHAYFTPPHSRQALVDDLLTIIKP